MVGRWILSFWGCYCSFQGVQPGVAFVVTSGLKYNLCPFCQRLQGRVPVLQVWTDEIRSLRSEGYRSHLCFSSTGRSPKLGWPQIKQLCSNTYSCQNQCTRINLYYAYIVILWFTAVVPMYFEPYCRKMYNPVEMRPAGSMGLVHWSHRNQPFMYKVGPYDRYKLSYKPCKWPYKWVTGLITLLIGVIILFVIGRGPPCRDIDPDCRLCMEIPYGIS